VRSIEFNKISFSYPTRPSIRALDNISFYVEAGQFIGIVGRSGVGKSTIMQLMLKFYNPTSGHININDRDLSIIQQEQIRNKIAYVAQDSSIFSGTIRSNIAFAKPEANEDEIMFVATETGIMDFALSLKDGIDTEIGERGVRLSGGQKQRIAISRAILYNPEILLLDEATSALDNESERKLLSSLKQLMKNKIMISIAHRISTIEGADEIFVIDQGAIIANGTHNELLKTSALYRKFAEIML
jgi:ATP-binding cassette subfamily B protein